MKLETILERAMRWNPEKILTQPDEDYVTLKEGEAVVDFNDELMMSYDGKETWQISYGDWIGDYENPIPVIDMIMSGYLKTEIEDGQTKLVMVDDADRIDDLTADINSAVEKERQTVLSKYFSEHLQA